LAVLRGEKLMSSKRNRIVILLTLSLLCACGRPPADEAANPDAQKLPFDRQPRSTGISPSQSLLPSTTKLPEGTPIPVRLESALSSASSHAGDTFNATVDEPVVVDGRTLLARGTPATGRVLESKPAASSRGNSSDSSLAVSPESSPENSLEPGYLRLVLVRLNVGGRQVAIETSSIFAKGGPREERNPAAGTSSGASQKDKNIVLGNDRRLSFRLAQTVDLQ
jgi:predicted small lipoprotein YifL